MARIFFVRKRQLHLPSQLLVGGALTAHSAAIFSSIVLIGIRLFVTETPFESAPLFIDQLMSVLTYVGLIAMSLEDAQMRMKEVATTDQLTGLANRRGIYEQALHLLRICRRTRQPMALLIADLDHFKSINYRYGHDCGDAVLKELARRIAAESRRGQDVVGRWGGEEFLAVLSNIALTDAVGFAERLRLLISEGPFDFGDQSIRVSVSIGVAEMDSEGFPLDEAAKFVDEALYHAKRSGRNRVMSARKLADADELQSDKQQEQKAAG